MRRFAPGGDWTQGTLAYASGLVVAIQSQGIGSKVNCEGHVCLRSLQR